MISIQEQINKLKDIFPEGFEIVLSVDENEEAKISQVLLTDYPKQFDNISQEQIDTLKVQENDFDCIDYIG